MYDLLLILILLALGYGVGSYRERQHFRSIFKREEDLKNILLFDIKQSPNRDDTNGQLVSGCVVVSVDYFKRFVAGLRLLFGGRLKSYESLLDRGRREAVLRMKEQARIQQADMIINVKYETASISKGAKNSIGSVEIFVYGSAIQSA